MRIVASAVVAAALATALAALLAAGGSSADRATADPATVPSTRPSAPAAERRRRPEPARRRPSAPPCPDDLARCARVQGRVVFVERVDPDGDGDLHVVVLDPASLSGPGVTAVDVRPGLRPRRDPSIGDRVAAMGQLQPGSYGQDQIHASSFETS